MSSIPTSAMPHAKAHDGAPAQKPKRDEPSRFDQARGSASDARETVTDAVKSHPKTAAAVGVAAVAGVAAAIAAPLLRGKDDENGSSKKKSGGKKKA